MKNLKKNEVFKIQYIHNQYIMNMTYQKNITLIAGYLSEKWKKI